MGVAGTLIALNVAVFLAGEASRETGDALFGLFALWPRDVLERGRVWQLLTHGFLHANGHHLLFNMLGLWWFGAWMEAHYGARRFAGFYLAAVAAGALAQVALQKAVGAMDVPCLGASGAVMAILAWAGLSYPRGVVYAFGLVPVQLRFLIPIYVALDLVGLGRELQGMPGGVAYGAHLGGAAFGALYWLLTGRGFGPAFARVRKAASAPGAEPVHRCATCGRTERDGRIYEFRFCRSCRAEYCQDHLQGHACNREG